MKLKSIDSICKKFGIKTRGELIKTAIKFFILKKPYEKFVKKYPNAIQAMAETVVIDKKGNHFHRLRPI